MSALHEDARLAPYQAAILREAATNTHIVSRVIAEVGDDHILLRGKRGSATLVLTDILESKIAVQIAQRVRSEIPLEEAGCIRVLVAVDDAYEGRKAYNSAYAVVGIADEFNGECLAAAENHNGASFHALFVHERETRSLIWALRKERWRAEDAARAEIEHARWSTEEGAEFFALWEDYITEVRPVDYGDGEIGDCGFDDAIERLGRDEHVEARRAFDALRVPIEQCECGCDDGPTQFEPITEDALDGWLWDEFEEDMLLIAEDRAEETREWLASTPHRAA